MNDYVTREKSRRLLKREQIEKLIQSGRPVYAWGIGREFLYLYESAGLKSCRLAGLIDANPFKQASCTVHGNKISSAEDILPGASSDSVLLITAVAHTDAIEASAKTIGFKGEIVDFRERKTYE